jgi:HAMP domain-containing protein
LAGHAAARLLQERGAVVPVFLASNRLPALKVRATLARNLDRGSASLDPAAPVRKTPPLLVSTARAERDR